jgi:hypothetical protein
MAEPRVPERTGRYLAKKKWRYGIVFLTVVATTMTAALAASPAPAARTAQGSATAARTVSAVTTSIQTEPASQTRRVTAAADPYEECLTNYPNQCVSLTGTEIEIIAGTTADVASRVISGSGKVAIVYLYKKFVAWYRGPGNHTKSLWSGYYEDNGDSKGAGANTNLCLGDTSFTAPITFMPCGANGTVWIEQPDNNGGNYNYDRYFLDNGSHPCEIASPGYTSEGNCMVMSANSLKNGAALYVDYPEAPGGGLYQDWNP